MFKSYTNIKELVLFATIYWFSAFILLYLYGLINLSLAPTSKMVFIETYVFFIVFTTIFLFLVNRDVFKVYWDDKRIIFKYLCCRKKKTYLWESISSIYYCPKFGVVHLIIATDDGEFYSLPDVSDKLYKALEKHAKVKIETIRHPMEVLPALWERQKNARKLRKEFIKRGEKGV